MTKRYDYQIDTNLEDMVSGYGVTVTRELVSIKEINRKNRTFQTREDAHSFDKETVSDYAEAKAEGSVFPSPLLARGPKGLYVVCGAHRIEADIENRVEAIGSVLVADVRTKPDEEKMRAISTLDNLRNGLRQTKAEAIRVNARLCLSESPSGVFAMPPRTHIDDYTRRLRLNNSSALRKALRVIVTQSCCERAKVTPPRTHDTCEQLFSWVDTAGFKELAEVVSQSCDVPKLASVLKQCSGLDAAAASRAVRDAAMGVRPSDQAASIMSRTRKVILAAGKLEQSVRALVSEVSVDEKDITQLDNTGEILCAAFAETAAALRKKGG